MSDLLTTLQASDLPLDAERFAPVEPIAFPRTGAAEVVSRGGEQ